MGHILCICSRATVNIENKRYRFIEKLGEGGFSYVDLVEGIHDGHFYALKRILCHDREGRREALHEVEMHQLFDHPNILHLVSHSIVEKGPKWEALLLLPFVKNGSLWNLVESLRDKNRFLPEERILHIFQGICKGLKAIHSRGYAHRDLKPTNVLLEDNDWPVLMDLGSMNKARIEVANSREAMALQVLRRAQRTSLLHNDSRSTGKAAHFMGAESSRCFAPSHHWTGDNQDMNSYISFAGYNVTGCPGSKYVFTVIGQNIVAQ